jgi:hypothetical protein
MELGSRWRCRAKIQHSPSRPHVFFSSRSLSLLCSDGARSCNFGHDLIGCACNHENAVLFIVCRACSGCCGTGLSQSQRGPLAVSGGSPKPFFGSERQPLNCRSGGGVGNAAFSKAISLHFSLYSYHTIYTYYVTLLSHMCHVSGHVSHSHEELSWNRIFNPTREFSIGFRVFLPLRRGVRRPGY